MTSAEHTDPNRPEVDPAQPQDESAPAAADVILPVTAEQVNQTAISSWYPLFRRVTPKTVFIPLERRFVDYLHADGVYLPSSAGGAIPDKVHWGSSDEESEDESPGSDGDEDDDNAVEEVTFPELEERIKGAIAELGGAVFPKLNWSAPRDAAWITTTQTLKCVDPGDVFLLFKSSDFIVHDLAHPYKGCTDCQEEGPKEHSLALRQWRTVQTGMEMRCFVRDKKVVGISQRDYTNFYSFLPAQRFTIRDQVCEFYENEILDKFPLDSVAFDVYFDQQDRVRLIDFNAFYPVTDPLLFEWSELCNMEVGENDGGPDIRVIMQPCQVKHSIFESSRYPRDVVDLSSEDAIAEFSRATRQMNCGGDVDNEG